MPIEVCYLGGSILITSPLAEPEIKGCERARTTGGGPMICAP